MTKNVGRPSKYKAKYCDLLIKHFDIPPNFTEKQVTYNSDRTIVHTKYVLKANDFPTFNGFCLKIGVNRSTLNRWVSSNEEFCNAYKEAKALQLNILIQNMLQGLYNYRFASFIAKNNFGWK